MSAYAFSSIGKHFGELSKANTLGDPGVYEFGGIALTGRQIAAQISLHAITGGVVAELQGGKFAHGFISAGFTKGALGGVGGNFGTRLVAHAVVGGTVSKLTGGKFANGARTGAFQFLFNEVKQNAVSQKKYQGNLVEVNLNGKGDTYLDEDFKGNVDTFIDEASKEGVTLKFNSAYRSPTYQKGLKGDPTAITSATNSLHSAGLAVDVNYASLSDIKGGLTGDQQRTIIKNAASTAGLSWGGNFGMVQMGV